MTDRTSRACAMLEGGASGAEVLEWLRAQAPNVGALINSIGRVRKAMMARAPPPCLAALQPFAGEGGVAAFLVAPREEQVRVQRAHRAQPTWSDGAEAALAALALLPANVAALALSRDEHAQRRQVRAARLMAKQSRLIHVHNATVWLAHAVELCRASHAGLSVARLALPLLLLSGRRSSEILNGRSSFLPTGRATTAVFAGALKKKGHSAPLEIPLLCEHAVFAHGYAALRAAQRHEQLSEVECNNKYHSALTLELPNLFPFAPTPHALRSVYAAYTFELYSHECAFNLVCMRVLLHESIGVSLSYSSAKLHDLAPACLGALP